MNINQLLTEIFDYVQKKLFLCRIFTEFLPLIYKLFVANFYGANLKKMLSQILKGIIFLGL